MNGLVGLLRSSVERQRLVFVGLAPKASLEYDRWTGIDALSIRQINIVNTVTYVHSDALLPIHK